MSLASLGDLGCAWTHASEEEAAEIARRLYGVEGKITRFAAEKDDTFHIAEPGGDGWVLKIANPAENPAEIAFQIAILDHIAATAPDLPTPRVRRDRAGEPQVTVALRGGPGRQARMMSFMTGAPLDSVAATGAQRRKVGETLARLRLALADFAHPADSRVLFWDVRHLLALENLMHELSPAIPDPAHRTLIERAFLRFRDVAPEIARTRFQVLHNDFSGSNIVVDPGQPRFVCGVIDFGDAVRTSVAVDVATALASQLPREGCADVFAHGRDLLAGYLSVADLTARELALAPHLVMARVVARALLANWRARMMPGNAAYLLRNAPQAWAQLQWFLSRDRDAVSASLSP